MRCRWPRAVLFVAVAAVGSFALTAVVARADAVISDTFTANDGTSMSGWVPDTTNLPGAAYVEKGGIWTGSTIQSNSVTLNSDRGVSVSMASSGAYVKPTKFSISASLNLGTVVVTDRYVRGMGIGFYSTQDGVNAFTNFCGVYLDPNGLLRYGDGADGESGQTSSTGALPYAGSWNAAAWHTLSYTVDTVAGTISNLQLDGTGYSFAGGNPVFTDAQTAYAGFDVSSSAGDTVGMVDNFVVSTVASLHPGDANSDGKVDIADLNKALTNYNHSGMAWADGDFDGDGLVTVADLNKVLTDYNKTVAVRAVPEPSTAVLLAIGALGLVSAWRGRS